MWYKILGVRKDASVREIESAYKILSNSKHYQTDMEKSMELRKAYSDGIAYATSNNNNSTYSDVTKTTTTTYSSQSQKSSQNKSKKYFIIGGVIGGMYIIGFIVMAMIGFINSFEESISEEIAVEDVSSSEEVEETTTEAVVTDKDDNESAIKLCLGDDMYSDDIVEYVEENLADELADLDYFVSDMQYFSDDDGEGYYFYAVEDYDSDYYDSVFYYEDSTYIRYCSIYDYNYIDLPEERADYFGVYSEIGYGDVTTVYVEYYLEFTDDMELIAYEEYDIDTFKLLDSEVYYENIFERYSADIDVETMNKNVKSEYEKLIKKVEGN